MYQCAYIVQSTLNYDSVSLQFLAMALKNEVVAFHSFWSNNSKLRSHSHQKNFDLPWMVCISHRLRIDRAMELKN